MTRWQRRARFLIAAFAVVFAAFVVREFKHRGAVVRPGPIARMDPKAVAESTRMRLSRVKLSHEDLSIEAEQSSTYTDGSSKLVGVRVTTANRSDGRSFVVTAKEGQVHPDNPTSYALDGDVQLTASDGLRVKTEHATYAESDATVRAPGPVEFSKGRMAGTGVGMTYEKNRDLMTILDQAIVHMAPDDKGAGAANATAGTAAFARREKYLRFEHAVRVERAGEVIEAETATAYLSDDEKRITSVELRENSRVTSSKVTAGALQWLTGRDINLSYAPDGELLQHVLVVGNAVLQLAGEAGKPGRQLSAVTIDTFLGPDGSTPTALAGRDAVQLTFPAEPGTPARVIRAASIDAVGEAGRGLTKAKFAGNVDYRETNAANPGADRSANSATLDLALKPGMSTIDEAKFAGAVRFTEGQMLALAAAARYVLEKGQLELSGTEPSPGPVVPHVANELIGIDAAHIDVALAGPSMKATGTPVQSVLQPPKKGGQDRKNATKLPSLLKQDQAANVTADALDFNGASSQATYVGNAQLWQGDTAIRGDTIEIDDKTGDLTACGNVSTTVTLDQVTKDPVKGTKTKERVRSTGNAADFRYEDAAHRATYSGGAHLRGPQGDMTASTIELYLKPSGNELDRAEAYDEVKLSESGRKTSGSRMTFFAEEERYKVTGTPVMVIDDCGQETSGRTLTFLRATDTITVDGTKQFRTQGKGSGKCPGS